MKSGNLFILLTLLILSGCATSPMTIAPEQQLPTVASDEAQVVFMRTSHFGGAISASLYKVSDTDTEYLGIIAVGTKIALKTEPGEHMFMVVSEAADFMEAELEGGKTYYAMVTPRMGAWKARFSLWPISNQPNAEYSLNSDKFQGWVSGTKLLVQSQQSLDWYQENKTSVEEKKAEYLPVWYRKDPADIELRTLQPGDGL